MKKQYRQDIDGLRSIAVLAVVLYHFDFPFITGGFVGVDIFFVISGYLISLNIYNEIAADNFSILNFYERRFRRLFPALATVLIVTTLLGLVILSPTDLLDLGRNIVATTLFSANLFSYLTLDYFAAPAEFKPLLHAWSLAVEEQFYFVFPIFALMTLKFGKNVYVAGIFSIFIVSLLWSTLIVQSNQAAAFYLPHLRAWELALGCIVALPALRAPTRSVLNQALGLTGLLLIIYSIFAYTHESLFPGLSALPPTLGTAFIILAGKNGRNTVVGLILSNKYFVATGLISYSLYLWHWPIIVYAKYIFITDISIVPKLVIVIFMIWISHLSTKFIEAPFRHKVIAKTKFKMFRFTALVSLLFCVGGTLLYATNGIPARFGNVTTAIELAQMEQWKNWGNCINENPQNIEVVKDSCFIGNTNNRPTFILWGDSHARSLGTGVSVVADNYNRSGIIVTHTACAPLSRIDRVSKRNCYEFNESVFKLLEQNSEIKTVLISARWALAANGTRYGHENGKNITLGAVTGSTPAISNTTNAEYFKSGLKETIARLEALDKNIYIIDSVPEIGYNVPHVIHMSKLLKRNVNSLIAPTVEHYSLRNQLVNSTLNSLSQTTNVKVINVAKKLCSKTYCDVVAEGKSLYRDDNHLSFFGSMYVSEEIACSMQSMSNLAKSCSSK